MDPERWPRRGQGCEKPGKQAMQRRPFPASEQTPVLPPNPTREVLVPEEAEHSKDSALDPLPISSLQRGRSERPGEAAEMGSVEGNRKER